MLASPCLVQLWLSLPDMIGYCVQHAKPVKIFNPSLHLSPLIIYMNPQQIKELHTTVGYSLFFCLGCGALFILDISKQQQQGGMQLFRK